MSDQTVPQLDELTWRTPWHLRVAGALSRRPWASATAGMASLPLAVEIGAPLVGAAGYLIAVAALSHNPLPAAHLRRLAFAAIPPEGLTTLAYMVAVLVWLHGLSRLVAAG